jgi:hypothetical protein
MGSDGGLLGGGAFKNHQNPHHTARDSYQVPEPASTLPSGSLPLPSGETTYQDPPKWVMPSPAVEPADLPRMK